MNKNPNPNDLELVKTGRKGNWEHYRICPSAIAQTVKAAIDIQARNDAGGSTPADQYGCDSADLFDDTTDEVDDVNTMNVATIDGKQFSYVPYGDNDDMPLTLRRFVGRNMVTAQCLSFDTLACYGQGVRFIDRETRRDTDDKEILQFCLANSVHETFMEQAVDMKYYYFTAAEIILNRDQNHIVSLRHLDACFCRLEKRDPADGRIHHLIYGDFRSGGIPTRAVAIPLLDPIDPLGDLLVRTGQKPDPVRGTYRRAERCWKYAIITRMPTPGCRYYPIPPYVSIFRDHWYDIYRLIGLGKKYLIKNTSAPRIQIEVHIDYWDNVCDYEGITDPEQRKKRIDQERRNLVDFVCGPENAGKALVSNYSYDLNGKEQRMIRIVNLNSGGGKEGGDWSDDLQEASNALCFALGVHPNLIGATPGKSQMNNSGSDKRELFTLKQATEKPFHDIMLKPWHVVLHFNGWSDRFTVDVPMIELTTLDKGTSAQTSTITNAQPNSSEDDNNNQRTV